ncbi:hypothetical protein PM082_006154 [Marasmius tenuissimus]|nr:hypothetical protein PM082_006154 [Marasmius tenuissimus]
MSYPHPRFCYAENGQQSIDSSELSGNVYSISWRDCNINSGPGTFTVNNNNRVIQQARLTYRHIRGTEEEEAEYEEYDEYKRSDIQLYQEIHRERVKIYDQMTDEFVSIDCKQHIFLGEIVSGDRRGMIVTVEAYDGHDAPERWKRSFASYSGHM